MAFRSPLVALNASSTSSHMALAEDDSLMCYIVRMLRLMVQPDVLIIFPYGGIGLFRPGTGTAVYGMASKDYSGHYCRYNGYKCVSTNIWFKSGKMATEEGCQMAAVSTHQHSSDIS